MTVIWDGDIQSICRECGNDCRNAIRFEGENTNVQISAALCDSCILNLATEIHNHYAIQEYGL